MAPTFLWSIKMILCKECNKPVGLACRCNPIYEIEIVDEDGEIISDTGKQKVLFTEKENENK